MARWEKHGTTSNATLKLLYYWANTFKVVGNLIYPIKSLIEVIEYQIWMKKTLGDVKVFKSKKELLDLVIEKCKNSGPTTYYEFGVAFGETAEYIVNNAGQEFEYHGFDTFEGLPKAWRRLPKGAITNHGKIPNLVGSNIFFHKGLIQDTIGDVSYDSDGKKCILFDFDLYEPTLLTLKHLEKNLHAGDILYFDEAFDSDERVIIENYFIDKFSYNILGASVFGLAFELK
jgi:hypothetical protein